MRSSDSSIAGLHARRVWDSRGNPTVEVEVATESGEIGRAIAPAGVSRGTREAIDLRDGGDVLGGLGVGRAVLNVQKLIAPELIGVDATDQEAVDEAIIALDHSALKARLGGNSTVAVSLAVMNAAAAAKGVPVWQHCAELSGATPSLPLPEIQIFGGGAHAGRRVDIQDFMIMVPGASSFDEALEITSEVYRAAGSLMSQKGALAGVADEGGWWPVFNHNEEALETLIRAIELAGEKPGDRVVISLDVAASEFGSKGKYRLALEDRELGREEMIRLLGRWIDDYAIASIEDPLAEDDKEGMRAFTQEFGRRVQIIGDDYLVTNTALLEEAITDEACNAVLIKVNQVGTVSEALDCLKVARKAGLGTIVSARSGETEDVSISHMAVGFGAQQIKVGSFSRSERMAKWNECLRIGDRIGQDTFVSGKPLASTDWARNIREGAC
ncbi:phosphopyruvate hydratase [Falsihalocynthiibacter sp. SS001]|uniref:phosphopyruvate hydratase n=1 Tax=Falsihalocynthiibacter sp. SS001 TaxID=3349698 RepID=UPI0036D29D88